MKRQLAVCISILLLSSMIGCSSTDNYRKRDVDSNSSVESGEVSSTETIDSEEVSSEGVLSVPDMGDLEGTYNFLFGSDVDSSTSGTESDGTVSHSEDDAFAGLDEVLKNMQSTADFVDSLNKGNSSGSTSSESTASRSDVISKTESDSGVSSKNTTSIKSNSDCISESSLLQNVEMYLNNKYIYNFKAVDVVNWNYMDSNHVLVRAYDIKHDDYYFSVVCDLKGYKSGSGNISFAENYVASGVKSTIATSFESALVHNKVSIDSAVACDFGYRTAEDWVDSYNETNYMIYTHDFIEKHNVDSIYLMVAVNGKTWNSSKEEVLIKALENTSHTYQGTEITLKLLFVENLENLKGNIRREIPITTDYIHTYGKVKEPKLFGAVDGKRDDSVIDYDLVG